MTPACPFASTPALGAPEGGICNDAVMLLFTEGLFDQGLALQRARLEAFGERLKASNNGAVNGIIGRSDTRAAWACILPEMSDTDAGVCRLQFFDERGFSGHRVYSDWPAALEGMAREHYIIPDPGALERAFTGPDWNREPSTMAAF